MRLRVAKKLVKRAGAAGWVPRGRLRRAAYRYLRWPGRPRLPMESTLAGFHYLDEQHRIHPPTGDFIRDAIMWEVCKAQFFDETPNGWVSTIFLGLNHGYGETPMWFETAMSRSDGGVEVLRRHQKRDEAEAFHYAQVEALRTGGTVITEDR